MFADPIGLTAVAGVAVCVALVVADAAGLALEHIRDRH